MKCNIECSVNQSEPSRRQCKCNSQWQKKEPTFHREIAENQDIRTCLKEMFFSFYWSSSIFHVERPMVLQTQVGMSFKCKSRIVQVHNICIYVNFPSNCNRACSNCLYLFVNNYMYIPLFIPIAMSSHAYLTLPYSWCLFLGDSLLCCHSPSQITSSAQTSRAVLEHQLSSGVLEILWFTEYVKVCLRLKCLWLMV